MTTIYIPMPEWQALAFLRDRQTAFLRLLSPAHNPLPCEVVLTNDTLFGFRVRNDGVAFGKRVYPHGFAVTRIVLGKEIHDRLVSERYVTRMADQDSGLPLWALTGLGVAMVRDACDSGQAEILVDQIIAGGASQSCGGSDCRREHRGSGGRSSSSQLTGAAPPQRPWAPVGPTGFGC